jgi:hypothetical protein
MVPLNAKGFRGVYKGSAEVGSCDVQELISAEALFGIAPG